MLQPPDNSLYKYQDYPVLNLHLFAHLGSIEAVDQWYDTPNEAFDLKPPIEVAMSGDLGHAQVYNHIHSIPYGE